MDIVWHRIQAIMLRILYFERRNVVRMAEFFYWPLLDITMWGMTASWIEQSQKTTTKLVLLLMAGLVLWQVTLRSCYEISITLMEEIWGRSLINLFASPLNELEWIIAVLLSGLFKVCAVLAFGGAMVGLLYACNIFSLGLTLLLFVVPLVLSGWCIGFFSAAAIMRTGQRAGSLPWIAGYLFAPFSGVFYPVESLPVWMQRISYCLPTTYVFESMRQYIENGMLTWDKLVVSVVLSVLYLTLALGIFLFMFKKSRSRGLYRLE
jgi:ABC-2 type transport system permease protein